jgi:hypothetical protein
MTDDDADLLVGDVLVVMAKLLREAATRLVAVDKLSGFVGSDWPALTDVAVMLADAAHALAPITQEDQP